MDSVKSLPYTFAVKDTENTLENKKPCLAWTLFGLAIVVIITIFVLLYWLNQRNIQIEVTAVAPTADEIADLDRFECTCLKYPYRALFKNEPRQFVGYMVDGQFRGRESTYGSLYTTDTSGFGFGSTFDIGLSMAVSFITGVDPLGFTTDISFSFALEDPANLATLKKNVTDNFITQVQQLTPTVQFDSVGVCDVFGIDCAIFDAELLPPYAVGCGLYDATLTTCLAAYGATDITDTCDGGNGTLPCSTLIDMYKSAMPDQIASDLIYTSLFPLESTIPTGGGSQDYDVSEDITVYVDANDNEYYYTTSSQYGFYDYDYSAFDDYTAEFDKDSCFQFTCTTVQTESKLSFLIRTASYTITAQGFVLLGAGILFKVCAGSGGGDDDGGKNGQQQGAPAEVPLEDVDNDKAGLTGVIVDDVASTGRKSSSTSSSHNSGTTSSP